MKTFEQFTEGSLHKWFKGSKSKDGKPGWVNVKTGGTCASDEPGEGTPKCVSSSKRASMTKAERDSASRRKKAADPGQQQKSGAAKPTYVATDKKKKVEEAKDLLKVAKELTKASKMHKGQAEKLKKHADDMKSVDEACWKGYKAYGMKKKGGKMVPNCKPVGSVKKEEKGYQPEIEHSKLGDAKKKADKKRESSLPPHLQGDAIGKMKKAFASEAVKGEDREMRKMAAQDRAAGLDKRLTASQGKRSVKPVSYSKRYSKEEVEIDEAKSAAWQRKEGKRESGGLNQKGVDSYRRENPGSKLKTAVTTKPSKLKKGSKSANRRKSFCARMSGMKKKLTSAKTANDPDSRINKSLRKWNCSYEPDGTPIMEEDKAFNFVLDKIRKEVGKDGYVSKNNPRKPATPQQKAKVRAHQAKVDAENAAERKKDPSQGRYPKG